MSVLAVHDFEHCSNDLEHRPLHHAACGGHKEIAELFIDNAADVNANYHGNTVLCNVTIELTGFYQML